jgi:hypothetical protein
MQMSVSAGNLVEIAPVQGLAEMGAKACSSKHMMIASEFEVLASLARAGVPIDVKERALTHSPLNNRPLQMVEIASV